MPHRYAYSAKLNRIGYFCSMKFESNKALEPGDYYLTPEQEKERKEQRKELNRKEREMRKAARQAAK